MPTTEILRTNDAKAIHHLAQNLLYRLRKGEDVQEHLKLLKSMSPDDLGLATKDDDAKKAFWINIYNSFNLYFMKGDEEIGKKRSRRMKHFFDRKIEIVGRRLSLQDIEHGLMRRSKAWWGLGYIPKFWVGKFERKHRLAKEDPRIHFALNCGARSCPPIRFYEAENIHQQLEIATGGFMLTEVEVDESAPTVLKVSSIFRLYVGDFGGKRGIVKWVKKYRPDLPDLPYKLHYIKYDWTTDLDAFA